MDSFVYSGNRLRYPTFLDDIVSVHILSILSSLVLMIMKSVKFVCTVVEAGTKSTSTCKWILLFTIVVHMSRAVCTQPVLLLYLLKAARQNTRAMSNYLLLSTIQKQRKLVLFNILRVYLYLVKLGTSLETITLRFLEAFTPVSTITFKNERRMRTSVV